MIPYRQCLRVFMIVMVVLAVLALPVSATTYYVSNMTGSNLNTGTSQDQAWKTLTKVNSFAFSDGDTILFNRSNVWIDSNLVVLNNSITIADYGIGSLPKIDGLGVNDGLSIYHVNNVVVKNISIDNSPTFGVSVSGSNNTLLLNIKVNGSGNDNILVSASSYTNILNVESSGSYNGTPLALITNLEIADNVNHTLIDNLNSHDSNGGYGLSIHAHSGYDIPSYTTVINSTFTNNTFGINYGAVQNGALIGQGNNKIENVIVTGCAQYSLYVMRTGTSYPADLLVSNSTLPSPQVISIHGDNITIQKSTFGDIEFIGSNYPKLLSNTIFLPSPSVGPILYFDGSRGGNFFGRNNIIEVDTSGEVLIWTTSTYNSTGWNTDYNNYYRVGGTVASNHWRWKDVSYNWSTWKTISGADFNSFAAINPLFVSKPTDLRITSNSPMIDNGTPIGFPYYGSAPDIGYYEYPFVLSQFTPTSPPTIWLPNNVTFTDNSTGDPTAWIWSYKISGVGTDIPFNTSQNATFFPPSIGDFTISLNASNSVSYNISTQLTYVHVVSPNIPIASFTANVTSGRIPLAVQFIDTSIGNPTSWLWTFSGNGDVAQSILQSPVVVFSNPGIYSVNLTASNGNGTTFLLKSDYITAVKMPSDAVSCPQSSIVGAFTMLGLALMVVGGIIMLMTFLTASPFINKGRENTTVPQSTYFFGGAMIIICGSILLIMGIVILSPILGVTGC